MENLKHIQLQLDTLVIWMVRIKVGLRCALLKLCILHAYYSYCWQWETQYLRRSKYAQQILLSKEYDLIFYTSNL
jgi:hypothetical protein